MHGRLPRVSRVRRTRRCEMTVRLRFDIIIAVVVRRNAKRVRLKNNKQTCDPSVVSERFLL